MLVCYLIQTLDERRTYIGATNDFSRRIKQHNRILSGGAKSTAGYEWKPLIHIVGFQSRNQLLRFEWLWKHCMKTPERGIYRRIQMLEFLLEKDEWVDLRVLTSPELASLISCQQEICPLELAIQSI